MYLGVSFLVQCRRGSLSKILEEDHPALNELTALSVEQVQSSIRHSLRLNADVAARAWVFFGSLIVGGKFILRSLIYD